MSDMRLRRTLPVLMVALAGCTNPVDSADFLLVASDAHSYLLGQTATLTIVNPSKRTVTFRACSANHPPQPDMRIDKLVDGEWTEIDGVALICAAVFVPISVPLHPGESMTVAVSHSHGSHVGTVRVRIMDTNGSTRLGSSNRYTVVAD